VESYPGINATTFFNTIQLTLHNRIYYGSADYGLC